MRLQTKLAIVIGVLALSAKSRCAGDGQTGRRSPAWQRKWTGWTDLHPERTDSRSQRRPASQGKSLWPLLQRREQGARQRRERDGVLALREGRQRPAEEKTRRRSRCRLKNQVIVP